VYEVTKCSPEQSFFDLDTAFSGFLKQSSFPNFKKKGVKDSFLYLVRQFSVAGCYVKIPKLGRVKMTETLEVQWKDRVCNCDKKADWWFISLLQSKLMRRR
jgi:hypothetical protein